MAEITGALLGDDVYLVFEQYVIKAAEKGGASRSKEPSHPHGMVELRAAVDLARQAKEARSASGARGGA